MKKKLILIDKAALPIDETPESIQDKINKAEVVFLDTKGRPIKDLYAVVDINEEDGK